MREGRDIKRGMKGENYIAVGKNKNLKSKRERNCLLSFTVIMEIRLFSGMSQPCGARVGELENGSHLEPPRTGTSHILVDMQGGEI